MRRARQIKALKLMQRIEKMRLDEQSSALGKIRAHKAKLDQELDQLSVRQIEEGRIDGPESAPYLAGFLRALANRRLFLEKQRDDVARQAELAEDHVRATYSGMRRTGNVLDRAEAEIREDASRSEDRDLDEAATMVHNRRD